MNAELNHEAKKEIENTNEQSDINTIRFIFVQTGQHAVIREIKETLEAMEELVGGIPEEFMPFDDEVAIICDAEAEARDLPMNRTVVDDESNVEDIVKGDFFIAYAPVDSPDYYSLPQKLEEKYLEMFYQPEMFFQVNDEIRSVKFDPDQGGATASGDQN